MNDRLKLKRRRRESRHLPADRLIVAAYGMGVNSTAFIIDMVERGERIDLILAADTGGEFPHVYAFAREFSRWLILRGYPKVTMVRKGGRQETLEDNCLRLNMLPSLAYGFKGCSHKYKIEPQEKFLNNYLPALRVWGAGGKVTRLIGYDADEPHRASIPEDKKYLYRYPCLERNWGRAECEERISRAGLKSPGGSSCFFCPATTKPEILAMRDKYPLLLLRALHLESNAKESGNLRTVNGLGRRLNWAEYVSSQSLGEIDTSPVPDKCGGCYDSSPVEESL